MSRKFSSGELLSVLDDRLEAFSRSGTSDWRVFEEPQTRGIELDQRPLVLLGAGALAAADFVALAVGSFEIAALIDNMRVGQILFGHPCGGDDALRDAAKKQPGIVAIMCCAGDVAAAHFAGLAAELNIPLLSLYQARKRVGPIRFGDAHGAPDIIQRLVYDNPFIHRFADETSLCTYYGLLLHRLSWSQHWLDQIRLLYRDLYFGTDVFSISPSETFVDGGAFDGDTIRAFDRFSGHSARQIYAFEPDSRNIAALQAGLVGRSNVAVFGQGLWSETTTLAFHAEGTLGSSFDEAGSVPVPVVALDDTDIDNVTLIKMDIEGAEVPALSGSRKLIARCQPKLAICAYHLPDDLIEIPKKILEINPDYRLFLRHHSPWLTDTVIYGAAP